jgi:ribose transport system ATP-binding protein
MSSGGSTPVFEMRGIRKTFPGVVALDDVSFAARAGEVHALCGENGAGKSTLMKILSGVDKADSGDILLHGKPVAFDHPAQARDAGISVVHQELSLLPDRTVAQNLFLGREPNRWGVVDRRAMEKRSRDLLSDLFAEIIPPDTMAGTLPIAQQQVVEIAKAMAFDASIIVLDEPTAALEEHEVEAFKAVVRQLRDRGVAIVYISHRMEEVFELADTITVLKDGAHIVTAPRDELDVHAVVLAMVGRELKEFFPPRGERIGAPLLTVSGAGNGQLTNIDLTVNAGEVLGIAGLEGSGKGELGRALFGADPFTSGSMQFNGKPYRPTSPRDAIAAGIGYLPENRKDEGIVSMQSVRDNCMLTMRARLEPFGRPNAKATKPEVVDRVMAAVDIRAVSPEQEIRLLSGGNQQKAIVARWLARDPGLLIFAEPTRGIDVNAKASIYRLIRDFADRGKAVLVISSDLPEIVGISDRIVVMHVGTIIGECPGGATEQEVMRLAMSSPEAAA